MNPQIKKKGSHNFLLKTNNKLKSKSQSFVFIQELLELGAPKVTRTPPPKKKHIIQISLDTIVNERYSHYTELNKENNIINDNTNLKHTI